MYKLGKQYRFVEYEIEELEDSIEERDEIIDSLKEDIVEGLTKTIIEALVEKKMSIEILVQMAYRLEMYDEIEQILYDAFGEALEKVLETK